MSRTNCWNAASVGMNAVSATVPSVSTLTGESGLASSTASTAAVSTSKSRELRSKPLVSCGEHSGE